jgi:hypothetical protein
VHLLIGQRESSVRKGSVPSVTSLNVTTDLRKSLPDLLSDVDKHSDPYLPQQQQQQRLPTLSSSPSSTRQTTTKSRSTQFSTNLKHSLSSDSILDVSPQPPSLQSSPNLISAPASSFVQSPRTIASGEDVRPFESRALQPPAPPLRNQRDRLEQPPPLPPKRSNFPRRIEHANIVNNGTAVTLRAPNNFATLHANHNNHLNHLSNSLAQVSLSVDSVACFQGESGRSDLPFLSSTRKHHSDNGQFAGQLRVDQPANHSQLSALSLNDSNGTSTSSNAFSQVTLRSKLNGNSTSIYRRRNDSLDDSNSPSPPPPGPGVQLRAPKSKAPDHRDSSSSSSLGSTYHDKSVGRPRSQYDNLSLSDYDYNESHNHSSECGSNNRLCDSKLTISPENAGSRSSAENQSLRSSSESGEDRVGSELASFPNHAVRINLHPPDDPPPLPPKRKNIATYMQMLGSYGKPSEATLHANYRHSVHVYRDLSRTQSTYQQVEQSFRQQRALDLQLSAAANAAGLRRARATRYSQDSAISAQSFCSDSCQFSSMQWQLPSSIAQALQQSSGSSTYLSAISNHSLTNLNSQTNSFGSQLSSGIEHGQPNSSAASLSAYPVSLCTSQCSLNSSARTSGSSTGLCVNSLASDLAASLANQLASGLVNQLTNGQLNISSLNGTRCASVHNSIMPSNQTINHALSNQINSTGNAISPNQQVQINCAINRDLPPMLPPKRSKTHPPPLPTQLLAKKPEAYQVKSNQAIVDVVSQSPPSINQNEDHQNNRKHLSDKSLERAERYVSNLMLSVHRKIIFAKRIYFDFADYDTIIMSGIFF